MKKLKVLVALSAATLSVVLSTSSVQAQETRAEAAAHLRTPEPKEMDPHFHKAAPFAQKLVDEALAKHPEILLLAIHAGVPKYDIIASNFGRIGKLGDEDDLRCIRTGKDNLEVNKEGIHFEDQISRRDKSGKIIGTIGTVFRYKQGDDKAALEKIVQEVRGEMQAQLPNAQRLFGSA